MIGSAMIAFILAMLAHTARYTTQLESISTEHDLLRDMQDLATAVLHNTDVRDEEAVQEDILLTASLVLRLAREKGFRGYAFCFCNQDDTIYAFNNFNESAVANFTTSSSSGLINVSPSSFGNLRLDLKDFLALKLNMWNAELCVNQTIELNTACGCLLGLDGDDSVGVGKTLNLNWC